MHAGWKKKSNHTVNKDNGPVIKVTVYKIVLT